MYCKYVRGHFHLPRLSVSSAHGGGHVNGGAWKSSFEDKVCRSVCHSAQVVVIQVDFRLAPEHPSPAQVDDCYNAYNWVRDGARRIVADRVTDGSSAMKMPRKWEGIQRSSSRLARLLGEEWPLESL